MDGVFDWKSSFSNGVLTQKRVLNLEIRTSVGRMFAAHENVVG